MKLFTIYDSAAKAFNDPFPLRHVNEAKRGFLGEINNPDSLIGKYPEDYALYECGEFNNNSGEFVTPDYPIKVCSALELKATSKEENTDE